MYANLVSRTGRVLRCVTHHDRASDGAGAGKNLVLTDAEP